MFTDWLTRIKAWFGGPKSPPIIHVPPALPRTQSRYFVAQGVLATLFDEYADHRQSLRGNEEIGWLLLGRRSDDEIHVVGTIPAGTHRDASAVHVSFDIEAQTLASRIVRQTDRRLQIVGIVHTHPGSMRHPSDGDLHGDKQWIRQLQYAEGLFAIGTADGRASAANASTTVVNGLCFSWYALGADDADYRRAEIDVLAGADVGSPLRDIWAAVEWSNKPINRICQLFAAVRLGIITEDGVAWVRVAIVLPWPGQQLYILLSTTEVRYYWEDGQSLVAIDPQEADIEVALLMILTELTRKQAEPWPKSR